MRLLSTRVIHKERERARGRWKEAENVRLERSARKPAVVRTAEAHLTGAVV